MGYFPEIQAAATKAERILAEITGKAANTDGNTLFAGQTVPVTGVYGRAEVQFDPVVGGGYRKRTNVPLTITRTQLPTAPKVNTKLTRIDLTPAISYNVLHVSTQDPLVWQLMLVSFGE